MGWLIWLLLTAACLSASYAVSVAAYRDRSVLDRVIVTLVFATFLILVAVHLTGIAGRLEPTTLGLFSAALFAATHALALRWGARGQLVATLRSDLSAPWGVLVEAWRDRELAALALVPASMAAATCTVMVWFYRSWTWDPVWYHIPKTSLAIQNRSIHWFDIPNPFTQGNPHNVELLAVWNCIFPRDNRLDDSSQLPFLLLGLVVIAAWARKVGASRPLALGAGAAWVAMPPVYLQAHSTHADVVWNSLYLAALYFTLGAPTRRDRWMGFLCWGVFLGSKYTGIFHLGLWAPWLLVRGAWEIRDTPAGQRFRRTLDVVASGLFVAVIGGFKVAQNWIHAHNPMFPFDLRVRALGLHFHGPCDPGSEYGAGAGGSPTFFGAPNALRELVTSWFDERPFYSPDVRSGGFGPVFRWVLLACVVAVALDLARGRNWRRGALPILLFFEGLQVPVPYMTRFILSVGGASLVAFCIVHSELRIRALRVALSAAFVALTAYGYAEGTRGFIVHPRYFEEALRSSPLERNAMQIDTFLWPSRFARMRERELRGGHVFAYDEGVHFLGELFNHDYSSTVLFVSSRGDPTAYLRRLVAMRARWVGVTGGSAAEGALRAHGAEYIFSTPDSPMAVYRMPTLGLPSGR